MNKRGLKYKAGLLQRKYDFYAYLFLLPTFLVLFTFRIFPIFLALTLSFFKWDLIGEPSFTGIAQFAKLHSDPLYWKSIRNTIYYAIGTVPLNIFFALFIALLLNKRIKGIGTYRTIYFIPVITSVNAVSIVWKWIYNQDPSYGVLNQILGIAGVPPQKWLLDPALAMPCIIVMSVWKGLGYNVIIFLTGLKNIPRHLYEAAIVDGASRFQQFRKITWPLLTPVTFFILIMSTIGSFQVFSQIYMMTPMGGPMNSTSVIVFYLYKAAFSDFKFGYASAMAFELFLMIFTLTIIQKFVIEKRVHYQ